MTTRRSVDFALLTLLAACGGDPDVDPPCDPAGACCNDRDLAAVTARYGPGMDLDYVDVYPECAEGAPPDAGPDTRMDACLDPTARGATSAACDACYRANMLCNVGNCVGECIAEPGAPACIACRCGANAAMEDCYEALAECSGVPLDACEEST